MSTLTRTVTRVIKIGGRAQGDPALAGLVAAAAAAPGARVVVVHGGGDEVSALQRQLGGEPTFSGGRRVTTRADVGIVQMVLSGTVNKRLTAQLLSAGVRAVGISGEDGAMICATLFDHGSLGAVGEPASVDPTLCLTLLDAGFVPVVSPLGRSADDGTTLNVNGDDAAAALASALGADELLLVADVPGVLRDGTPIAILGVDDAAELVADGTASGGMAAKLDAARRALVGGVRRVRISDIAAIADRTRGTSITLTPSAV